MGKDSVGKKEWSDDVTHNNQTFLSNPFKKKFMQEFSAFKVDVHSMSFGRLSYSNKLSDSFRVAAISYGSAIISTSLGLLVSFGVISIFVSLGIGCAVSLTAITAGICYNVHLYMRAKKKYARADNMLDIEDFDELNNLLADNLALLYDDRINCYSKAAAITFARHCESAISNAILMGKVDKLSDLLDIATLKKLMIDASKSDPVLCLSSPQKKIQTSTNIILTKIKFHQTGWSSDVDIALNKPCHPIPVQSNNNHQSVFGDFIYWIRHSIFSSDQYAPPVQVAPPEQMPSLITHK